MKLIKAHTMSRPTTDRQRGAARWAPLIKRLVRSSARRLAELLQHYHAIACQLQDVASSSRGVIFRVEPFRAP